MQYGQYNPVRTTRNGKEVTDQFEAYFPSPPTFPVQRVSENFNGFPPRLLGPIDLIGSPRVQGELTLTFGNGKMQGARENDFGRQYRQTSTMDNDRILQEVQRSFMDSSGMSGFDNAHDDFPRQTVIESNRGEEAPMLPSTYSKDPISPNSPLLSPSDTISPMEGPTQNRSKCSECHKKFTRPSRARRCENKDKGIRPYQCNGLCGTGDCAESFYGKDDLTRHCKPKLRDPCTVCGRVLLRSNLPRHVRRHSALE